MKTVADVLEEFYTGYDDGFYKIHQRYLKKEITIEEQVELSEKLWNKLEAQALLDIEEIMLGVIGEDYRGKFYDSTADGIMNSLRQQQRQVLKKRLGGEK